MKEKTVVIVGGAAGAIIASEIFQDKYDTILYLETYAKKIDNRKILANKIIDGVKFIAKNDVDYFIATGDNTQREQNYNLLYNKTHKMPVNCIHSTAWISSSSSIGYGNLICPYSIIHTDVTIGNNTIINTASVVEHNCIINDYAQISPNVTLCGYVEVEESSFIGAGSVVIPKIKIGRGSLVAAGSSVIEDIPDKKMYAGVPARFKKDL